METKLTRIAQMSREQPKLVFSSIYHMLNKALLRKCHEELEADKAVGIDNVTKAAYSEEIDNKISDLVERLRNKSYKPMPVKRVYIPKGDGKEKRPLGISAYEDKIV